MTQGGSKKHQVDELTLIAFFSEFWYDERPKCNLVNLIFDLQMKMCKNFILLKSSGLRKVDSRVVNFVPLLSQFLSYAQLPSQISRNVYLSTFPHWEHLETNNLQNDKDGRQTK